eukprot:CAMPEP_0119125164 /NCGR_PEP_ID=MMETSP1310-20130426/4532_1 /TAXON_ID=464262 /ORGANISM="Genus nov. species nov., Strain RCC2339" /LENGTH=608 /DNA_ID=CAMNT_0007115209 /DNA_START=154 /DNA_END=1980 /DNA_ORIENTATION=+
MAKVRKLVRFLKPLSLIFFVGGLISFIYYPDHVAESTYMSEHALMPGGARCEIDEKVIGRWGKTLRTMSMDGVLQGMASIVPEYYVHTLEVRHESGRRQDEPELVRVGVGIVRARSGSGTEAIVVAGPVDSLTQDHGSSVPPVLLSLMQELSNAAWLHKDIIFLMYPKQFEYEAIGSWLESYVGGVVDEWGSSQLPRVGMLRTAICLDSDVGYKNAEVLYDGVDGRLPNLDLLNCAMREGRKTGVRLSLGNLFEDQSPRPSSHPALYSPLLNGIQDFLRWFRPYSPYPYTMTMVETFLSGLLRQAIGRPNGIHAIFQRYRIEALSVGTNPQVLASYGLRVGCVLEGLVRNANNLIETLHQSFYQYFLPHPFLYISIGHYMVSFGFVVLPSLVFLVNAVYLKAVPLRAYNAVRSGSMLLLGCLCLVLLNNREVVMMELGELAGYPPGVTMFGLFNILFLLHVMVVSPTLESLVSDVGASRPSPSLERVQASLVVALSPAIAVFCLGAIVNFAQSIFWVVLATPFSLFGMFAPTNKMVLSVMHGGLLVFVSPPAILAGMAWAFGREPLGFLESLVGEYEMFGGSLLPNFLLLYFPLFYSQLGSNPFLDTV